MTTPDEPSKSQLQLLLDDARDFPATMFLGAAWLVVFAAMLVVRLGTGPLPSLSSLFVGNIGSAHDFGDLTLNDLARGEIWRVLTCTFVHYNVLHVGMNLYGLYQLGTMLESWYGSSRFLAIYVVLGGGGNLVSALVRQARGMDPRLHSGGGSTVVLGLVALCAVVGWRARSRFGDFLRGQMVGILLFTAFLGQVLPMIDNWGHAGGALMGALVGFGHRWLIGRPTHPAARAAGLAAAVVLVWCGAAQWRDYRHEASYRAPLAQTQLGLRQAQRRLFDLYGLAGFYQLAALRSQLTHGPMVPATTFQPYRPSTRSNRGGVQNIWSLSDADFQTQQTQYQTMLDQAEKSLGTPPTADDYAQVRSLLDGVLRTPPTPRMTLAFRYHLQALIRRTTGEVAAAQARRNALARAAGLNPS